MIMRAVMELVGGAVRGARPSLPTEPVADRRTRSAASQGNTRESGSDGRREALRGKGC